VSRIPKPIRRLERGAEETAGRVRDRLRDRVRQVARPRAGTKRTLLGTIAQIPQYLRLLAGLMLDRRVSPIDKVLVGAAIAYIILPLDFIPDAIPFLGEVDDVFLLMTALQRLIQNSGRKVLLDHWTGPRSELSDLNVERVLGAAAFFLPLTLRRKLRGVAKRA
jgi:uncharacterized membrane protein YkvA (DUF1232 family)